MQFASTFSGVTDAQITLVEYWKNIRKNCGSVYRSDIDPGSVRAHLSAITLIEMAEDGRARVRLAGTRVCELIGHDPRGECIREWSGNEAEALALTVDIALDRGQPVGGINKHARGFHAWLRLPLKCNREHWSQVLCHDELLNFMPVDGDLRPRAA